MKIVKLNGSEKVHCPLCRNWCANMTYSSDTLDIIVCDGLFGCGVVHSKKNLDGSGVIYVADRINPGASP